uniref:Trehalose-phosphatase n=1 Tax=Leersia perrieri TaxID=77586 RepID=A0A0D9W7B3_9ORYZ
MIGQEKVLQRSTGNDVRDVQVVCDLRVEASVYYEFCSLRVSNENLQFNILYDMDMLAIVGNQSHVTHNQLLNKAVVSLITDMARKVAKLSTEFATCREKLIGDSFNYTLYGLVQCSPELSGSSLSTTGSIGGRKSTTWCSFRYELYHFFAGPPLLDLSTYQTSRKTKGNSRGHHKKAFWVVISIACVIVIIVSLIALYFCWKKWLKKNPKSSSKSATNTGKVENIDQVECPSALASFEQITTSAHGKKVALFLDYDGTLSPIVDNAKRAFMPPEIREAVKNIARLFPTSIVSGRSREKLWDLIEKIVHEVVQNFEDLRTSKGQMIYSKDSWNKGNVVEYLLDRLGLNFEDVLPIFIGDDTTDENAFKVLRQRQTGLGILVSKDLEKIKVTTAMYTLKDPYEVITFILISIFCRLHVICVLNTICYLGDGVPQFLG